MNEDLGSKGSDDEPLVPDEIDEEFFTSLLEKVPEVTKFLRQKDEQEKTDNVQRLVICSNRFKSDYHQEQIRSQELKNDIAALNGRLREAAELSELDKDTIAELRKVIETAWKQKDAAQSREQAAKDEVVLLREKVITMEETIEQLNETRKTYQGKQSDKTEIDELNTQIHDMNKRLNIQRMYTNEVEGMTQTLEEKNKGLLKLLDEFSTDAYSNKKLIDQLQTDLTQTKSEVLKYTELVTTTKNQSDHLIKVKVRQNLQILSLKTNLEHLNTQHNATCNKLAKIIVDLEYMTQERDKLKRELAQRVNLLKVREDELIKLKQENARITKSQENASRKYANVEETKRSAEEISSRLKTQLNTQEKELEAMRRVVHQFEKNNNNLTQERDLLKRNLLLKQQTLEETENLVQETKHEIKALQETINNMDMKYKKLSKDFAKVEKEKSKKNDEIQTLIDKIDALQNEIRLKENCEIELKRTVADIEVKCSKFQAQQDALVNEKQVIQRTLSSAEDDKTKMKEQLTNLQNNVETLKSKVSYRDAEISKLQLQIDRMEKERRYLKTNIRHFQLGHQHTKSELIKRKKENDRYSKSAQEDNIKIARQKKYFDNLMDEKNSINSALTKRNEEYTQLKDKLDNLQSVYDQTEKQFSQCQSDMRIMRLEIKNLRTERNVLRKDRESAVDCRHELLQVHRALNQERIKARALQDEMLTPMNIHRWRNLGGTDPERLDLIKRQQTLQKQILNQNIASVEKERALQESQQLYGALKEFMLKLPSYKIKDELNELKATLNQKVNIIKALKTELDIKNVEDKGHNNKLEELQCHLNSTKIQLNEEKKKKQKLLEERQLLVQMQAQCFSAPPNTHRVLGGGFKIVGGGY
ncbi:cilia- and flagella-associated protein 58-like [Teleopsis dalmanni]|uniref:cilia- and flagella-associated protein 58-like n=1 Tax=Teleopsis dalmanni TaxID=139649 RepID=UPI0018CD25B1|nr:cilia- and flagella-associated protein 58-like [Teleopsis dalmanni]